MKYKNIIILSIAILAIHLTSCDKKYEDAGVTVQPAPYIEVLGANPLFILKGLEFEDPGIYTELIVNDDTLTEIDYKVLGKINTDLIGNYTLTYEVRNNNNIPFYATRKVSVVDFTGYDVFEIPIGEYDGIRVNRGKGGTVVIEKIREGIYSCSDVLGGYYDQFAGYGPDYAATALLIIDADGNLRSELGYVSGWGQIVIKNASFNSATNVMSYTMVMTNDGFSFDVSLTLK